MSAVTVSNQANFGALASEAIAQLLAAKANLDRVNAAVANAGGYNAGTPAGSVFEISSLSTISNNFGVLVGVSAGSNGAAWAYAVSVLAGALDTFMTTNSGQISLLDNGVTLT